MSSVRERRRKVARRGSDEPGPRSVASSAGPRRGRRHVASALACTSVGVLPTALYGSLGPLVRDDLDLAAWWIGVGVAVAFAVAALASVPAGRLAERLGSRRALLTGVSVSTAALAGIALAAHSLPLLLGLLALGGLGNAVVQPAANLALARGVGAARRGLAFGFKQAAIPAGTAMGGFAVPLIGVTLGWRPAFALAAGLAALTLLLPAPVPARPDRAEQRERFSAPTSLWLVAVGVGLSSAASNAMAAYLVESAIAGGWEPGQAGVFLGIGSTCGIASRVLIGWASDRIRGGWLTAVAALMLIGAVGLVSLAFLETPVLLAVGVVLGFAAGWGHNGLVLYAVVRLHPGSPAAATGVTQLGSFAGPVIGPPVFGLVAATWSHRAGWLLLAATSVIASLLVVTAVRQVARERLRA